MERSRDDQQSKESTETGLVRLEAQRAIPVTDRDDYALRQKQRRTAPDALTALLADLPCRLLSCSTGTRL